VVLASGGYPGAYQQGKRISGLEEAAQVPGVKVFHAGTARQGENYYTAGGRVLGVTSRARNLDEARMVAYTAAARIHFDGMHMRNDIGAKPLKLTK
jgi:phosphoribosylamine---glycine ligase